MYIRVDKITATTLLTTTLSSTTGTILVDGDLILTNTGSFKGASEASSFLSIAEDVTIGGVKQWKLLHHDHFEKGAEGWSLLQTSSCSGNDRFLGGHCNIATGDLTKRYDKIPPHKQVLMIVRL